jgi:hypothetical protein
MGESLFELGRIVATPDCIKAMEEAGNGPGDFLSRHQSGDWGECDKEDAKENDLSIDKRLRIISVYRTKLGVKIRCITEADRSSTTLLLPADY